MSVKLIRTVLSDHINDYITSKPKYKDEGQDNPQEIISDDILGYNYLATLMDLLNKLIRTSYWHEHGERVDITSADDDNNPRSKRQRVKKRCMLQGHNIIGTHSYIRTMFFLSV